MTRKLYTQEFKRRAVALLESGGSVKQLSLELDVPENNLYAWRKAERLRDENAYANKPQGSAQELQLRRLRAQVANLEEERDILEKAAAWFAKESEQSTR